MNIMNKKIVFKLLLVFTIVMILWSKITAGGGILVDPSVIKVNGVVIGKDFELKASTDSERYFLSVANTDDRPAKYQIEVLSCKEYGYSPQSGYKDIPTTKWIKIKSPEILVPAKQTGYVKDVFIKIPKKKEYDKQRWQAIVKVLKKASAGEMAHLEVVLPLMIETERKPVKN